MNTIKYIILLTIFSIVSCTNNKNTETENPTSNAKTNAQTITVSKAQFENAQMMLGQLEEKEFAETIQTSGIIEVPPQNMAIVSAFSGGYIKNTPLLIGDRVKKGQHLVTIENPEFITMQQNYVENLSQLSYLKSEYERQKTMYEENITSQRNYLKAESDYKTAVARTNSLKKNLEMLNINPASVAAGKIVSQVNIYSPIEGNVTQLFVSTGSYVSPSDKIIEIMNTDHVHVELKVFEKDVLKLKKGQEILFKVPEASKEVFTGDVYLIGTTIDPQSRLAMIHGHIDETNKNNFTAGMFVEAEIVIGTTSAIALPEDAVVELEGKYYVLVLENEDADAYQLNPIEVKIDANYKGFTSFKTTLEPQSRFLTKGGYVLLQGDTSGGHEH